MNLIDQEMIVKTLDYMNRTGQLVELGNWTMAIEEDGTATFYPLGEWKDRLVLRMGVKDEMFHVVGCNPKDWNDCGGEAVRTRRDAWDLIRNYLEMYGG